MAQSKLAFANVNTTFIILALFGAIVLVTIWWECRRHRKMQTLYIDVPYGRPVDWTISPSIERVLEHELNLRTVKFICNSGAGLSDGDLYAIELRDDDSDVLFYLRTGIKPFPVRPSIAAYREIRGR